MHPIRTNDRGNTIYDVHDDSDRYRIDFAEDFKAEGWQQFDTHQDAHYFGVWVNKQRLMTLTDCEGDWSVAVCPDAEHYDAEVANMCRFYAEGFIAKAYGADGCTTYVQDRREFFITPPKEVPNADVR